MLDDRVLFWIVIGTGLSIGLTILMNLICLLFSSPESMSRLGSSDMTLMWRKPYVRGIPSVPVGV